jgi:hypothetical protein
MPDDQQNKEARTFQMAAGALMVVLIGFGILNLWGVI